MGFLCVYVRVRACVRACGCVCANVFCACIRASVCVCVFFGVSTHVHNQKINEDTYVSFAPTIHSNGLTVELLYFLFLHLFSFLILLLLIALELRAFLLLWKEGISYADLQNLTKQGLE